MRFLGGILIGVLLAFGIPALAHDIEDLADHHEDCALEHAHERPAFGAAIPHIETVAVLDPNSPHSAIRVTTNVCLDDLEPARPRFEIREFEDGRYHVIQADVSWHVGDDGLAWASLTHLDPSQSYQMILRIANTFNRNWWITTDPAPPPGAATTTSTTTTLPTCVMPTTTTSTSTTTTTTTTTVAPATAVMPNLLGQGALKADAEAWIIAAGLTPGPRAVPTDNPDADLLVIAQDPPSGAILTPGAQVTFDYYQYTPPTE